MQAPGELTALLQRASGGDQAAAEDLYRLVEKDLRAIAGKRKQRLDQTHGEPTTVLVDEAFRRLVGGAVTNWQPGDRARFFCYAANKIHDLLVEAARTRLAQKRGGDRQQLDVHALDPASPGGPGREGSDFIIDLKEALDRLDDLAPNESRVFRIYYFLGCTFDETADVLQLSATEVKRLCKKAQTWLQRELKDYNRRS